VQLKTKQITGFEALLRWQHPEQGLISPYKFMAAAENTGLLRSTGQWLILEACKQLQNWKTEIPAMEDVNISANISAKQLADPHFVTEVETGLRETGIDPSQLRLELTEAVAAADPKLTATVLSSLKQLRVGVILDDFGTGNSSLIGLRQLPVEALKIDRSLVNGMLLDRSACDTVELILLLAHKLKLTVIAEGIESAKQLETLTALGCQLGQGYLFSVPVEAKAAGHLLRERSSARYAKAARISE
jgi:EAL domain-containing protein (putative c-di-GMP-specific phosphodiesterase class I)